MGPDVETTIRRYTKLSSGRGRLGYFVIYLFTFYNECNSMLFYPVRKEDLGKKDQAQELEEHTRSLYRPLEFTHFLSLTHVCPFAT